MKIKHRGQTLSYENLLEISQNFTVSYHAQQRINERHKGLDVVGLIRQPQTAYFNTDGSVNIALNRFEYLVIATDSKPYKVVTFKERSLNGKDVYYKKALAERGIGR